LGEVICKTSSRTLLYTKTGNIFSPSIFSGVALIDAGFDRHLAEHIGVGWTGLGAVASRIVGELVSRANWDANAEDSVSECLVRCADSINSDSGFRTAVDTGSSESVSIVYSGGSLGTQSYTSSREPICKIIWVRGTIGHTATGAVIREISDGTLEQTNSLSAVDELVSARFE
jgi:hypothetical protein